VKIAALERYRPESRKAWRAWLRRHHAASPGVLLVFAKKRTGVPTLSYDAAVEEALCFGWIDTTRYALDGGFYLQAFMPRKPRSAWSALNRERAARMIEQKLMTPAGMALIELAKRTGTWTARAEAETLTVPPELRTALNADAAARHAWPALTPARRKTFLYYLLDAKRPETRAARIAEIVRRVAEGRRPGTTSEARPSPQLRPRSGSR
jgi:uncharacterized protein YdeI (YjbR/CyaY-like superfamily)